MKLNPHLHAIAVDGIYVPGLDEQPSFRAWPRLKTDEVSDVLGRRNQRRQGHKA